MTGGAYATSAEIARQARRLPRLRAERRGDAARHPQPQARRRRRTPTATRSCRSRRRRSTTPRSTRPAPPGPASRRRRAAPGRDALALGADARLPQRPGLGRRADRHDRPRDGLRHHRHRARLRAGEVQEARRRRLLQDHQPRRARGPARARLRRGARSPRSSPTPSATPRSARRRASTTRRCAPRASPTRRSPRSRRALAGAFDIRFVFNKWTLGADFLTGDAEDPGREARGAGLRPARRISASPRPRSRPPTSTSAAR